MENQNDYSEMFAGLKAAAAEGEKNAREKIQAEKNQAEKILLEKMSIYNIACLIKQDWGRKIDYAAKPYLEAMFSLEKIDDTYGYDSGKSIVLYFLSNASTWRGDVAKQVKAHLKKLAGIK